MAKLYLLLFILFALTIGMSNTLLAQGPDVKFGKISFEELEMQVYPKDTSAGAVVLFNKGSFNSTTFVFTHFYRLKILKPSEFYRANLVFYTPSKSDVSGYTYNLSADHKIIKEKLKSSSFYTEELIENFIILKVAMPNVKVGSVIDVSFSHRGFPYQWEFQDEIPTVWSELKMDGGSDRLFLNKNQYGFEKLFINESGHWIAKDVPAIKAEPYISSLSNYITKLEFSFTNSWQQISEFFYENQRFGAQLRGGYFLNSIADSINNSSGSDLAKVNMALAHIKKSMIWNGITRPLATDFINKQYKQDLPASSADMNLCLILLLKKLGYEAYPVVLSTRENGYLSPASPSLLKLNNVIACLKLGEEEILLDASEKNAPLGLLPVRCLNLKGRIINKDQDRWVSLEPKHKFTRNFFSQVSVVNKRSIEYRVTVSHDGYAALEQRENMDRKQGYQESRKTALETSHNVVVKDYSVSGRETLEKPLREEITLHQSIGNTGDYILINPVVGQHFTNNPFFLENRTYPIDFIYPFSESYTATIVIPEGYDVETLPGSAVISLPDNAGKLIYKVARMNQTIQLKYSFELNQFLFGPEQYQEVKHFLALFIRKTSANVVLKKRMI